MYEYTYIYGPDIKLFVVELWPRSLAAEWLACGWIMAEAVTLCPEECPIGCAWDRVFRGGTAGAAVVGGFSQALAVIVPAAGPTPPEPDPGPGEAIVPFTAFGPLLPGWLTCSRFRRVTSSVLRVFRRCWRCEASFDEDASAKFLNYHWLAFILFLFKIYFELFDQTI